ncbi:MAG: hypothetical protein CSA10_00955 [Cardiobacteriales bacterium]|nr:MAG: hypothetical protein CSA10_00955 [Cardiobacteriales bacterium]
MIKFFKKLFSPTSDVINYPTFQEDELCRLLEKVPLSPAIKLLVGAGQVAVVFNASERSKLYPTGEYNLNEREKAFLSKNHHAHVLYLKTSPPTSRRWAIDLSFSDDNAIRLTGRYTIAIDNAKVLTDHLLQANTNIATSTLDQWVHTILQEIVQSQHITVDDIHQHHQRFEQFLIDAINSIIADRGLSLRFLTVLVPKKKEPSKLTLPERQDKSYFSKTKINDPATTSDSNKHKQTDIALEEKKSKTKQPVPIISTQTTPSTPPVDDSPKLFYRVKNGVQIGPISAKQLQWLIDKHEVKRRDLIWKKGTPAWQHAESFEQFDWTNQ